MKYIKSFEYFDTEELKGKGLPPDFKKMVELEPYKNKFEYGLYAGNSFDLNNAINHIEHNRYDRHGILEYLYKILIKEIPEVKTFVLNEYNTYEYEVLNFRKNKIIVFPGLDDDYSTKIEFSIKVHMLDDEILEYEKDKFKLFFSPSITTTRISANMADLGGIKSTKRFDGSVEISDEECDNVLKKLDKLLYGKPDKEDAYFSKVFKISENNLTVEELVKLIPKIKENLYKFKNYIKNKYEFNPIN